MSTKLKWSEIIDRLEQDLKVRESGSSEATRDNAAWEIATNLLWINAQALAFTRDLQQADVEDLIQRVLIKLQSPETMRKIRAAGSPGGYIFVMLRNAANDLMRQRQFEEFYFRSLGEKRINEPSTKPKYAEETEQTSVLAEALKTLTEDERELLRMRFWRTMTIQEIATEKGLSYSAMAVRFFRITHRLRKHLESLNVRSSGS